MAKGQNLTTFIGGIIDRLSYVMIAIYIVGVLLICATYFWLLNPYGHGTDCCDLNWLNSLYYSVITFSSLGYGDIAPLGIGKVVAALEVLSGLILTAIFIGKIASERQSATLRLIYTSEHQRRLVEFDKEVMVLEGQLSVALTEHNHEKLYSLSRTIYRFIAGMNKYLFFQAKQGNLASNGNNSSFRRLYKSIFQLQETINDTICTYGTQQATKNKFEQAITRINNIAVTMINFHSGDNKINSLLTDIQRTKIDLVSWNEKLANGNPDYKFRSDLTDYLLNRVKEKMPMPPWPKNVQKILASELGIQNLLAQKCINKLIEDGYWK